MVVELVRVAPNHTDRSQISSSRFEQGVTDLQDSLSGKLPAMRGHGSESGTAM